MKITIIRLAVLALILLEIGNVPGYDTPLWVYVMLILIDYLIRWIKAIFRGLGLDRQFESTIYQMKLDFVRDRAVKRQLKILENEAKGNQFRKKA